MSHLSFLIEADRDDENLFWTHLCADSLIVASIPLTQEDFVRLAEKVIPTLTPEHREAIADLCEMGGEL